MGDLLDKKTQEEEARFFVQESIDAIGYVDTVAAIAEAPDAGEAIDVLAREWFEGVSSEHGRLTEIGHSPTSAWGRVVDDDWPEWVRVSLAETLHLIYSRMESEEARQFAAGLEQQYSVPR